MSKSSTNSGLNPYAKYDFEGTPETREAMKNVNRNKKTKPLMTTEEWQIFCYGTKSL